MSTIGKRLRRERLKRGWGLQEVADKLGLRGHSTYSNWEYDKREPDANTINKLAELFGVSADYLLGTNNPNQEFIDSLDLSDEELIDKFNFTLDGKALTDEELRRIIAYIRVERQLKGNS